jgi:hypothetical protein
MEGESEERIEPPRSLEVCILYRLIGGIEEGVRPAGTEADVMKRIAAPMVGGMLTSTVLTLA